MYTLLLRAASRIVCDESPSHSLPLIVTETRLAALVIPCCDKYRRQTEKDVIGRLIFRISFPFLSEKKTPTNKLKSEIGSQYLEIGMA